MVATGVTVVASPFHAWAIPTHSASSSQAAAVLRKALTHPVFAGLVPTLLKPQAAAPTSMWAAPSKVSPGGDDQQSPEKSLEVTWESQITGKLQGKPCGTRAGHPQSGSPHFENSIT